MVHAARKTALVTGVAIPNIRADPFYFKDMRDASRDDSVEKPDVW